MRNCESASPTVCTDLVFITAAVEAAERRRTAVVDLSGAYLSADMDDGEEVLMVLRGDLANMTALTAPEVYRKYVAATPDGSPFCMSSCARHFTAASSRPSCSITSCGKICMDGASPSTRTTRASATRLFVVNI